MGIVLTKDNIDTEISNYKKSLDEIPLSINCTNILQLFTKLKRESMGTGPYSDVSLFEATNRIMSDLVILVGIKNLLNGSIKNIDFSEYIVDLGNDNTQEHDIMAEKNGEKLIGEAFNVSSSFFQTKKYYSLEKLRKNKDANTVKILLYNKDAVSKNYTPKLMPDEVFSPVDLDKELEWI